ncbi:Na+/H+ antiporter NhaC [Colwellia sp. 1_MG-2023]|jgi:NhaC family Na+:H+ antiporter|uniref:Na+/H+ antiporter NhaC n=1 Tax=unclassified Colwellia TaxID=196834 RepID=UPI001C0944FF|nr:MULTISPECIES: Na+/H+ antiporter NhaC [unclassified Colwellia]MBU2923407.1 Na+/H+ antiporter NhaC [Colwellia sp. C2M11]MDO6486958.1 Na+/H+ antiporter NhaC [Colwellia sp. 6_MG-2023]MDO6653767.1 Na+/H+ antiporter NhaC [Colwellia sp. 3_MG-2023]MDO6666603.1 Na+/H+ antiporter NhaC [Colwellia sp. 2_MG-2023]MDO6691046.1 Na+/H+ antiporter NhaC [Colwellia sp. 1_MG-2023]
MSNQVPTENQSPIQKKEPSMLDSVIPLIALVIMLTASVSYFADNSSFGPNQIALLLAMGIAILIGLKNGHQWEDIEAAIVKGISISLGAILILLTVGALIGTWLLSGTVPTMIYYGLQIIDPSWFYAACCLVCGIVAMSIGSSWTTAATVGVAFIGISNGFEMSTAVTAGAVISGAYFGDKLSPLSETTNLAPAVAGSELFDHIRYMLWTTIPSIVIALVLFLIIGFNHSAGNIESTDTIQKLTATLDETYNISVFNLIPLFILLALAFKKMPAFPAVAIGAIIGAIWSGIFQQELILSMAEKGISNSTAYITIIWTAFFDGIVVNTGNTEIDKLLSRGGMSSMLNTIWLVMCALSFGAVLERLGMLAKFVKTILKTAKSVGSLITSTMATCIGTNLITADQYMAIVMPGRMFKEEYHRRGLHPTVLSRTLEDSGTITSPLIPWNTCGAFMFGALALTSYDYIFYCFFNLINPVIAVIYAYTGFKIKTLEEDV